MTAAPQRLLITGGRGRLASLIADHFQNASRRVILFSRTPGPNYRALAELENVGAFEGADCLLHLGWSTLPLSSEQNPGSESQADLPALKRLLDGMARQQKGAHFVFFSSGGAVYGNAPGRPNREDDECRPIGRYGQAKLAAEELIRTQAARTGLPCAILRISNPYGYPVAPTRRQGIIPHALRCALTGDTLTLWGDGSARKDFLHYTDFLAALERVVALRLTGTFNLCAGESHSIREVLALVEQTTGRTIAVNEIAHPEWDVHDSRLDNSRIVAATGWRPHVSLSEGIRRAAEAGSTDS